MLNPSVSQAHCTVRMCILSYMRIHLAGAKHIFDAIDKNTSTIKKVVLTSSIWCVLDLGALTLSKDMALLSEKDTHTAIDMDKGPAYIYAASKVCSTEATPLHHHR